MGFDHDQRNELKIILLEALEEHDRKKEKELESKFIHHEATCPARRSVGIVRFLIGIPFIGSIIMAYLHYKTK